MEYPKRIVLTDKKLEKLLKEKADMILEGRQVSEEIDYKQVELDEIDRQIQELEAKIDVEDLKAKASAINDEFNAVMAKMDELKKERFERISQAVGKELPDKYEAVKKEKEDLENKRNKIALKAQKWNDKIIPLGRKLMKPYKTDEFDDYDTIRIENGEVVATIFNHVDDFKKNFRKRN